MENTILKAQLFDSDYVIYDQANDNVLQDSCGRVIIFGNKEEADADCRGNEKVMKCTELPQMWKEIILKQVNN